MKSIWLLRLYPREWRKRYGDELLGLIESEALRPRLIVDVVRAAVGEWLFVGLRSLGWNSLHAATMDSVAVARGGIVLACAVHMLVWALACLDGWFFGGSLSAHPEWWTEEALWVSAAVQLRSGVVAAVFALGLPLIFARSSHKTRSGLLDWLVFATIVVVSVASATLLRDVGPTKETVIALLGERNATTLIIAPVMFVADWARALGRRRLDPGDAPVEC